MQMTIKQIGKKFKTKKDWEWLKRYLSKPESNNWKYKFNNIDSIIIRS